MGDSNELIYCPNCGKVAIMSVSGYGVRHDCFDCNLWSYGGKKLVDKSTHNARVNAHNVFDLLWQDKGIMTRSEAYAALAKWFGMKPEDCHFGLMDLSQLLAVPFAVQVIRYNAIQNQREHLQKAQKQNQVRVLRRHLNRKKHTSSRQS